MPFLLLFSPIPCILEELPAELSLAFICVFGRRSSVLRGIVLFAVFFRNLLPIKSSFPSLRAIRDFFFASQVFF